MPPYPQSLTLLACPAGLLPGGVCVRGGDHGGDNCGHRAEGGKRAQARGRHGLVQVRRVDVRRSVPEGRHRV
eukprot:2494854-Pyramimonas_sp.AAC.1